jgi:uncharacterized coiled-coil protein SlyX
VTTTRAAAARAKVAEMREAVAGQMVLIRELSEQIRILDRRLRALETAPAPPVDAVAHRAGGHDPHMGRL